MSKPTSFAELIDTFDTIGAFANACHVPYETAKSWRRRDWIEPWHWPVVTAACQQSGRAYVNNALLVDFSVATAKKRAVKVYERSAPLHS